MVDLRKSSLPLLLLLFVVVIVAMLICHCCVRLIDFAHANATTSRCRQCDRMFGVKTRPICGQSGPNLQLLDVNFDIPVTLSNSSSSEVTVIPKIANVVFKSKALVALRFW